MRKYPLPQQYQQALQNPRLSLFDDELRGGTVESDKMGLPRVRSGNFASVYKIITPGGRYAVKCFLNAPDDIQERCEQIADCLMRIDCEYFLKVRYVARGISVNGQVYPVVRMPWQDGIPLDTYVGGCVKRQDRQGIVDIADKFLDMYKTLRSYRVAHGDLQHGNILITPQGGLRLIDYDGLYCPETRLNYSHESGHPNYQHPKRNARHYDEYTDTFSALVIFTALTVLVYDLTFWQKYYNGDNLLFCVRDFLNTNQSPLFRGLAATGNTQIRALGATIASSCLAPYKKMPDFMGLLDEINEGAGDLPPQPSTHSGQSERQDQPKVEQPKPKDWIPAFAGMTGLKEQAEGMTDSEPTQVQPYVQPLQVKVVCPRCDAINDQSTALCIYCGCILSIPAAKQTPERRQQRPPTLHAAKKISIAAKLRWSLLYFILFFLALAAYDQTDNNRAIPYKVLAFIKAGKDRLLGKIINNSGEIAGYTKVITADPDDAAAYIKRGDAYMKAGRVTEAADDYKAAARLAINTAAAKAVKPPPTVGDNASSSNLKGGNQR